MPNQMIALQARSPQLPDPTRRTAQFVNMMNMARQQEAAQRQAELAQQTMDINKAQEARAVALQGPALTKAQQDNIVQALGLFREAVGDIAEGDVAAAEAVRADLVARVPGYDKFLPPASTWDRNTLDRLMMASEKEIDKTIATPVASLEVSTAGAPRSVTVGGLRPGQEGVYDIPETPAVAPRATPTAPPVSVMERAPSATSEAPMTYGPDATRPLNAYQQEDLERLQRETGMTATPASFARGGMGGAGAAQITPEVAQQIVDTAVKTGMMAQADFDQLMALAPAQNKQPFMDMIRANGITLQPAGAGQQPQFADLRGQRMQSQTAGLRGAPPMEQTLAQMRTSTPLQQRNPNVSPLPGSSQVPLPRVAGEAAAEEGGKQGVRVKVEPVIAGATKTAQLRAEKDAAFSDAQSQFDAAYTTVNNRLADIKRFKAHPAATRVIGPLDAFTPNIGRARGAQQIYDTLVASATFDALQEMRANSPTGGALGNVSDTDIRLLKESIGALGQAQDEKDFFDSLRIYEDRLKQVRDRLVNRYRQSYGYRLGSNWKPPVTSSQPRTPTNAGRKAGGFTVTEVDE